ncbi:hypothetical protein HDU86_008526 [Geranomyces michiganensis]|nr:hypothetical protein HDU86_008526 [Geranomyces michiganensis]
MPPSNSSFNGVGVRRTGGVVSADSGGVKIRNKDSVNGVHDTTRDEDMRRGDGGWRKLESSSSSSSSARTLSSSRSSSLCRLSLTEVYPTGSAVCLAPSHGGDCNSARELRREYHASAYRFPNRSANHPLDFVPLPRRIPSFEAESHLTAELIVRLRPVVDFLMQEHVALNGSLRLTDYWLDLLGTKPDISCLRSDQNGLEVPILLTEVKKPLIIPNTAKPLHIRYREQLDLRDRGVATSPETCVVLPIQQMSGYMNRNWQKYGVLSTYDCTWFLCRDRTSLAISDPVRATSTGGPSTPSFLRAYAYMLSLVLSNEGRGGHMEPFEPSQALHLVSRETTTTIGVSSESEYVPLSSENNGRKVDPMTERFALENFEDVVWGARLGQGLHGTVIACVWKGGAVAMKNVDRKFSSQVAALKNEAQMYEALRSIQGKHIPQIFACVAYEGYQVLGLVMERGDEVDWNNPEECRAARRSLKALHNFGVAHGDVRKCNFVALPSVSRRSSARRIVCVDLGLAKSNASSSELALDRRARRAFC